MDTTARELAEKLMASGFDDLSPREQRVLRQVARRAHISKDINATFRDQLTFGQRLADSVAAFGGSWTFIIIFGAVLVVWVAANALLIPQAVRFDPYPFVFLNLILSMLAAVQAPVIMMSQNRQASKDRLAASHDYEVNLKAELEILSLHEKMDEVRQRQLTGILEAQQEQLNMMRRLIDGGR